MRYTMAIGNNDEIDPGPLVDWVGKTVMTGDGPESITAKITKIWRPEGSPLHVSVEMDDVPNYRMMKAIATSMGLERYLK